MGGEDNIIDTPYEKNGLVLSPGHSESCPCDAALCCSKISIRACYTASQGEMTYLPSSDADSGLAVGVQHTSLTLKVRRWL